LSTESQSNYLVAVIGAGPAGLFASRQLAEDGAQVILFNRDIKPGGLAEYGIYPEKHKMKEGLRRQFHQILDHPGVEYYGNVIISQEGDFSLEELKSAGVQALLVSAGAQGTKWLGLPGEEIPKGVYHAKDLVYHYNKLPPFSQKQFYIGDRVALVGAGNVMLDIARYLIRTLKVGEVIAVVRRGPAEVKFDKKEMEYVVANLDRAALDAEVARVAPAMEVVGQDVEAAKECILAALPKALEPVSGARFRFDFLASPARIIGNERGEVCGLEVEETRLVPFDGDTKAKGTGVKRITDLDTVIFCIGDRVDEAMGLPVQWNAFVKNPAPSYPVDGISYEAFDPVTQKPMEGIFVAGWSREASSGLVGLARKDGERGAKAILQYLQTLPPLTEGSRAVDNVRALIQKLDKPVITPEDLQRLEVAEKTEAERLMLEEFKFGTNEEMLAAMGIALRTP
jgi:ferredoxin--NADP+ reductase